MHYSKYSKNGKEDSMKEQLYTIPLNDAINAGDECPFCFIERAVEQDMLDYVLGSGSSYMESDMREITDKEGFCRTHFKKMFDYGNTLGNGWILKTHYRKMINEMKAAAKATKPVKMSFMEKRSKTNEPKNAMVAWAKDTTCSCYICRQEKDTFDRYMDTFFVLYKKDETFRDKVKNSKGFCITHFGDLCEASAEKLNEKEQKEFFDMVFPVMEQNMERLYEDVSWLIDKFDYRNKDADWKTSKDALQRGMQKLKGGYPADSPYKSAK